MRTKRAKFAQNALFCTKRAHNAPTLRKTCMKCAKVAPKGPNLHKTWKNAANFCEVCAKRAKFVQNALNLHKMCSKRANFVQNPLNLCKKRQICAKQTKLPQKCIKFAHRCKMYQIVRIMSQFAENAVSLHNSDQNAQNLQKTSRKAPNFAQNAPNLH